MAGLRERAGLSATVSPTENDKDLQYQPEYTSNSNPSPPIQTVPKPKTEKEKELITALPPVKKGKKYIAPHGTAVTPEPDPAAEAQLQPAADLRHSTSYASYETAATSSSNIDHSTSTSSGDSEGRRKLRKLVKRRNIPGL